MSELGVEPLAPLSPVGLWSGALVTTDHTELRDVALEVESLGYGSIWLFEAPTREPFVPLSLVLAATSTLVAGTGIANIWLRHPGTMQATARAITQAFPGRFLLGLGVSHARMMEPLFGAASTRPIPRMRAYLDEMDASIVASGDSPLRPPRVLAALGDGMLRLARDRAEGVHPYLVSPEHTAHAREVLGPEPLLIPEQAVVVHADRDGVRMRARTYLTNYLGLENYTNNLRRLGFDDADLADGGSDRLCDALIAGGEDGIRRRVQEHLDAGADHVLVHVLAASGSPPPLADWRTIAAALSLQPPA